MKFRKEKREKLWKKKNERNKKKRVNERKEN